MRRGEAMTEVVYSPKIKPEHLARKAIVYLRQSSERQVRQNTESQLLQYAVAERVRALGWKQVEIINSDLGLSARAGERVMASVSRFLTVKLRLKVNEAKSAVARPEERKFLGFSIANDGSERRVAPKALDTFKTRIREQTRRTRGLSLSQIIEELAPYLIGW